MLVGMFREHDFRKYDYVILDASCFLAPDIDSSVLESLRESRVCVSTTFYAEASAFLDLFPQQHRISYKTFTSQFPQIKTPSGQQSTWEMVRNLAAAGRHIAVVTGNSLLIDRIILEDAPQVNADIYDLFRRDWISYDEFQERREDIEFQGDERSRIPPQKEAIGYGTALYTSRGEEVSLCKLEGQIISGTESELFGVENLDGERLGIAKIFQTGSLTPGRCAHLQRLKEFAAGFDSSWCLLPKETLFRDESRQILAGILEDYVPENRTLFNCRMYLGDLSSSEELSMRLSDNLQICYNLVRQICYLNNYGFFISDFNLKNFALRQDDAEHILMFDTDSYGYKNYFAGFRAAGSRDLRM